jgi:hypothetical protein
MLRSKGSWNCVPAETVAPTAGEIQQPAISATHLHFRQPRLTTGRLFLFVDTGWWEGADCSRTPAGTALPFPLWTQLSGLRESCEINPRTERTYKARVGFTAQQLWSPAKRCALIEVAI